MMDKVTRLSYSKASTWKNCRKSYYWAYDRHLSPKLMRPEVGLGSSIHKSLANFYSNESKDRTKHMLLGTYDADMYEGSQELEKFKGGLEQKDKDNFKKSLEKGRLWLDSYWNKYSTDESIPKAKVENQLEIQIGDITLVIIPDAIIEKQGEIWTLEHKTGNPDIQQLLLEDAQSLYYIFGLRKLGYNAKGTIYNLISNPTRTSDGLIREETERTELELAGIEDEIKQIVNEINTLPRYSNRGFSCRYCFYRELCRTGWFGGDVNWLIQEHFTKNE